MKFVSQNSTRFVRTLIRFTSILLIAIAGISNAAEAPRGKFVQPDNLFPNVRIETNIGNIVVELDRSKAPLTVDNFLSYVVANRYDNTIFHRLEPEFVLQGGGYAPDMSEVVDFPPVFNESGNGLKNARLTIAMARQNDPHSATSQFFFNLNENKTLNPGRKWGYTVFGSIVDGEDVLEKAIEIGSDTSEELGWPNFPKQEMKIISVHILDN
jgi:peptidyl-prolyl cis-trans isomerase A (cyclophilin A)